MPRRANTFNAVEEGQASRNPIQTPPQNATDTPVNLQTSANHTIQKGRFTLKSQIRQMRFGIWINQHPAGIVIWALEVPGPAVFIVNFIAIIPLAAMLSYATEQIALCIGDVIGQLINSTFG
jgi:Ca2+:H+ antiporter